METTPWPSLSPQHSPTQPHVLPLGTSATPNGSEKPVQPNSASAYTSNVLYDDLTVENYKRKFAALIKSEERAHKSILEEK